MSDELSVTDLLSDLKRGDSRAQQQVFQHYLPQVIRVARQRLNLAGANRRMANESDVAMQALNSVLVRIEQGKFPDLNDGNSLWRILFTVVSRKAYNVRRAENCRPQEGESAVLGNAAAEAELAANVSDGKTIAEQEAVVLHETLEDLINALDDETKSEELRTIALMRLQGYSNQEIAAEIGRSVSTVEFRLRYLKQLWRERYDK